MGNIIQCLHIKFIVSLYFHGTCSILTLNPFLCLVCQLVLVFVIAPTGAVYAHFIADDVAVPLI